MRRRRRSLGVNDMGLAGIGLKLLGIGKAVIGWITAAVAWLFADWRRVAVAAVVIVFLGMIWHIRALNDDLSDQVTATATERQRAEEAEADFDALKEQHFAFVADVERQTAEAERRDRANAARVDREMALVRDRTADEYEARLADTRVALGELRDRLAGTSAGSEGNGATAGLSDPYAARCAAFGYADCHALLAALPDVLAAAEDNTGKLIALQQWARGVLAIDLNGIDDPPD